MDDSGPKESKEPRKSIRVSIKRATDLAGSSADVARQVYIDASSKGGAIARDGYRAAAEKIAKIQSDLREDYHHIFTRNPVVAHSMSQAPLLIENKELFASPG